MRFYHEWALRILAGQWTDHQAFIAMPGYSFLLAAVYAVGGVHPWIVGVLNAVSESCIAVVLFVLGRMVFGSTTDRRGDWIGVIAAAGWVFFTPAQAYALVLMPTTYMILTFWLVICWCLHAVRRSREGSPVPLWQFLLVGVAIGIMATIIATILFALPLVFAVAAFSAGKTGAARRFWRRGGRCAAGIACAIGGMLAGTSPCWIHNYFIAKDPVFLSAHGGLNFWIGNNPSSTGYPMVPPGLKATARGMLVDSFAWPPRWLHRPMKRAEISRFWSDRARAFIREQPGAWLKLMATKVGKFWSGYEYDDLDILSNFRANGVTFGFLTFGMVAMCGVPAVFFAVRESRRALWVVAAILLQMAALMPVFVTERYRLAAAPGLILLSSFALWWLWTTARSRGWGAIACYLALATPVIWWVNVPQSETGVLALEQYNKGIQALAANDFDRAGVLLEKAHQVLPDNADVNAALGSLALNRGDENTAKNYLHIALEHDPKNFVAWQTLGVIAMLEHESGIGAKCFEQAIIADPDDANSYMLLAKALGELKQYPDAIKAVDEAARLEPARADTAPLRAGLLQEQSAAKGGN
jgi:MFS family permease